MSLGEDLANLIEKEIHESRPAANERLGLRTDLMARYDATPTSLAEALQILRERGLITVKRGAAGGVFVKEIPPQLRVGTVDVWFSGAIEARQLFEARRSLETLLMQTALNRATPEDIQLMSWALDELQGSTGDAQSFFSSVLRFHSAIARTARVPYVSDLYVTMASILVSGIVGARFITGYESAVQGSIIAHGRLLEAIRLRDEDLLRRALHVHDEQELRETHTHPNLNLIPGHLDGSPRHDEMAHGTGSDLRK